MARRVTVVPHTHWDREWYKPFPLFRMQLVELLDGLLGHFAAEKPMEHFQLDGQMAVVEDYLEVRPGERQRLEQLSRDGHIAMGPWYTLPDEFLVSGETHVRNLALGIEKAAEFGGHMEVGYLPDMFGHIAQMPQILAGFGLTDAVVWRGVPMEAAAPAFMWEALDGTAVRAEYLSEGYGNGAQAPADGKDLIGKVDAFLEANEGFVGDSILWMNGTDHQLPNPNIGKIVDQANAEDSDFEFRVAGLEDHLGAATRDGLATWKGELRSGARANLLMGVASARVDVKQAAAKVERALERVAEPLAACWMPAAEWPKAFIDMAWKDVIRNAAHDSICGCSADEVNDAVLHRYAESTRLAEAITERSLIRVLAQSGQKAVAVNSTSRTRSGIVSTVVPGDTAPAHAQQISLRPAHEVLQTLERAASVPYIVREALEDPKITDYRLDVPEDDPEALLVTLVAGTGPKLLDMADLRARLDDSAAQNPTGVTRVEVQRHTPSQEILLRADEVPGFGWRGLEPGDLGDHAVRPEGIGLTNGLITVVPDASDGTFSLNGLCGMGRLVDDGDAGDTYNWSPPEIDTVVSRPDDVDVTVSEAGPVRGRLEITRRFDIPSHIDHDRRVGNKPFVVTTIVEVYAGEDVARISVSFDNIAEDHRVRLWFPLPEPADHSEAECAFGIVDRGLTAEGGPNEKALATYPCRRFVSAGGLQVVNEGVGEYELVDFDDVDSPTVARALAVTLIRSIGMLSQGPMEMRSLPAGPLVPTPEAQMPGKYSATLALHMGGRDPYEVADDVLTPLLSARLPGQGGIGDSGESDSQLAVSGAEVSALRRRDDGRLELRVVETTGEASTLTVAGRSGERTDLRGQPTGEPFDGTVELRPYEIATLALD